MDRREDVYIVDRGTPDTVGRKPVVVAPQILADFTEIPFPDEAFWHVVFDPPHYSAKSMSATSKLAHSYGMLVAGWEEMLSAGFRECFRVLKPFGTLIFKWCAAEISLSRVLALTPEKPLYGHRSGKKAATVWVAFIKTHGAVAPAPLKETPECDSITERASCRDEPQASPEAGKPEVIGRSDGSPTPLSVAETDQSAARSPSRQGGGSERSERSGNGQALPPRRKGE